MRVVPVLPPEILGRIVREQLREESLVACLRLRLVSRYVNQEVLRGLIDFGEVDRRFYREIIRKPAIDQNFVLYYWVSFIRRARRDYAKPVTPSQLGNAPSRGSSDSGSEVEEVSDASSYRTPSVSWASADMQDGQVQPRTQWLRTTLIGAVTLLLSGTEFDSDDARDEAFETYAQKLSEAMLHLLGGTDCMAFLAPHDRLLGYMQGEHRHLSGKQSEFYALVTAVYIQDWRRTSIYLEHYRIRHRRTVRWLKRLDAEWHEFSWKSSKFEKDWLEVLSACLIIATQHANLTIFHRLLDVEAGIFTPAFACICFNKRNALDHAIARCHLELFETLIARGWCVVWAGSGPHDLSDFYPKAVKAAADLSSELSGRLAILRILLILSPKWQRSHTFQHLLLKAAEHNDIALGELMISLLDDKPPKWSAVEAASFELAHHPRDDRDALDVATLHGHLDIVKFLLRNKKHITTIVPETWTFINPQRAVGQVVSRGEPIDLNCFREIVFAARESDLSCHYIKAAATASTEALAILAEHVDHHAQPWSNEIIVIEERRSKTRTRASSQSSDIIIQVDERIKPKIHRAESRNQQSSSHAETDSGSESDSSDVTLSHKFQGDDGRPSIGEAALANALKNLKVKNARLLVERFGVNLTWGSVKGIHVWETEEPGMLALQELKKLLAEHGMLMETKIIYAPVFHPGSSASTVKFGQHD